MQWDRGDEGRVIRDPLVYVMVVHGYVIGRGGGGGL